MADARTFVALELPEPVRDAIAVAIEAARGAPGKVSWVPASNLHLTLAFLGATSPAKLAELSRALVPLGRREGFELQLASSGAFPELRRPSVLWVGLAPSEALLALQRDVARACGELGFELDSRPFHPHITCARVKFPGRPGELGAAWSKVRAEPLRWRAEALSLMRSDPGPNGVRYTAVERHAFQ